jgi:hypothetical protein
MARETDLAKRGPPFRYGKKETDLDKRGQPFRYGKIGTHAMFLE